MLRAGNLTINKAYVAQSHGELRKQWFYVLSVMVENMGTKEPQVNPYLELGIQE